MGLDIYHYIATASETETHIVVDAKFYDPDSRKQFHNRRTNYYIDFEKMLKDRGENINDFNARIVNMKSPRSIFSKKKIITEVEYYSHDFKRKIVLSEDTSFRFPWQKKPFFEGEFELRSAEEIVVYCNQVGYKRKGVADQFFDVFPPICAITDFKLVEHIYDLTDDELKNEFKRDFLDCWDSEKSIVLIWY